MDKNITLTLGKYEYEQSEYSVARGHAYSVKYQSEGVTQVDTVNRAKLNQFDAIDSALLETLKRAARGYYEVNVTIEGATLQESLQTFLVDKYTVESQVTSVTFA